MLSRSFLHFLPARLLCSPRQTAKATTEIHSYIFTASPTFSSLLLYSRCLSLVLDCFLLFFFHLLFLNSFSLVFIFSLLLLSSLRALRRDERREKTSMHPISIFVPHVHPSLLTRNGGDEKVMLRPQLFVPCCADSHRFRIIYTCGLIRGFLIFSSLSPVILFFAISPVSMRSFVNCSRCSFSFWCSEGPGKRATAAKGNIRANAMHLAVTQRTHTQTRFKSAVRNFFRQIRP